MFYPVFTVTLIYKPILKSIRPKLSILLQKSLKWPYISKTSLLPKCHSPKSLLLLHFSMNLSETFRINVNMHFAHTNRGRNPDKKPANFGFWAQHCFGGLNQKSASISMCKVHIYIVGGVGFLVNDTCAKYLVLKGVKARYFIFCSQLFPKIWSLTIYLTINVKSTPFIFRVSKNGIRRVEIF